MPKRPPGVKAGLTREAVLAAALRIADEEGLPALTMRRLADRLGVAPMTLYDHVPNKAALEAGLVESVIGGATELELPVDTPWTEGLFAYASALRRMLLDHPGVLPLMLSQVGVTPNSLASAESGLTALHAAGFSLPHAAALLNAVTLFAVAHTATAIRPDRASRLPGAEKESPFDATRHPLTVRLLTELRAGNDKGFGDDGGFELTVSALIAGFEAIRSDDGGLPTSS